MVAAGDLAATRPDLRPETPGRLICLGLGEDEVMEVILSAAFANWTDRLALSLGEAVSLLE